MVATAHKTNVQADKHLRDEILSYEMLWAGDLGDADEYPALTCFPNLLDPAEQREVAAAALAGDSPFDAYNNLTSKQ